MKSGFKSEYLFIGPSLLFFLIMLVVDNPLMYYVGKTYYQLHLYHYFLIEYVVLVLLVLVIPILAFVKFTQVLIFFLKSKNRWKKDLIVLFLLAVIALSGYWMHRPSNIPFAKGLSESFTKEEISVDNIQSWLSKYSIPEKLFIDMQFYDKQKNDLELPIEILKLEPSYVLLDKTPTDKPYLKVYHGGHLLEFGVVVGTSEDELSLQTGEYRQDLSGNAFIWTK
jgi:hypothetical protein